MKEIKPNSKDQTSFSLGKHSLRVYPKVFLAGSIEMGSTGDWQKGVVYMLKELDGTLYNPRRDDWDSSWKQRESSEPFNEQVNWELEKLEDSDFIFMYFEEGTKSPISLLELGLFCNTHQMVVVCPNGFWKKGNVEVVCSRYDVPLYETMNQGIGALTTKLKRHKTLWK